MFIAMNKQKRLWDIRFHLLTCLISIFSKKMLRGKKSLHMNKNGFSEIFRCKEFASSRAEKARGCSNKVSKIAKYVQLNKLGYLSFAMRTFQAEQQTVNTFVAHFHPCVALKLAVDRIPRFERSVHGT